MEEIQPHHFIVVGNGCRKLTIYRWKKIVEEGRVQGESLGESYMEVRYEDVTQSPEYWMEKVCEFLNVEFSHSVLVSTQPQKENQVKGGGIVSNSGRWRNYFNVDKVKSLEAIGGVYLETVGYPAAYILGDKDPASYKVAWWTCKDYIRQTLNEIQKGIQKRNKRLLPRMFSIISTALKQRRMNRF